MADDLTRLLETPDGTIESKPALTPSLTQMSSDFHAAFSVIKDPMFKALRKDAIRLKLAKIEIATKLVADHPEALPAGYAEEFPKRMLRKLDCLTQIPVGPMFDKQPAVLKVPR